MNRPASLPEPLDTILFETVVDEERTKLEQRRGRRGIDVSGMFCEVPIEPEPDQASALLMKPNAKFLAETTKHDTEVFDEMVRTLTEASAPGVTAENILQQAHALFREQCGRTAMLAETTERDTVLFNAMLREILSQSTYAVTVEANRRIAVQKFRDVFGRPPMLREIPGTYHG